MRKDIDTFIFSLLSQKQFFDVVPISATGFLPPESNATTTPTATTPGISSGAASTTSPLNTGDVGGGKSGQQVCTVTVVLILRSNSIYNTILNNYSPKWR